MQMYWDYITHASFLSTCFYYVSENLFSGEIVIGPMGGSRILNYDFIKNRQQKF